MGNAREWWAKFLDLDTEPRRKIIPIEIKQLGLATGQVVIVRRADGRN